MATDPELEPDPRLTLKFDWGILPVPRLWNGPLNLSVIGFFSVVDPEGSTVSTMLSFPLATLWGPLKVCLSNVWALSELPPHADSAAQQAPIARTPNQSLLPVR